MDKRHSSKKKVLFRNIFYTDTKNLIFLRLESKRSRKKFIRRYRAGEVI